jgi:hypothetical protein
MNPEKACAAWTWDDPFAGQAAKVFLNPQRALPREVSWCEATWCEAACLGVRLTKSARFVNFHPVWEKTKMKGSEAYGRPRWRRHGSWKAGA